MFMQRVFLQIHSSKIEMQGDKKKEKLGQDYKAIGKAKNENPHISTEYP